MSLRIHDATLRVWSHHVATREYRGLDERGRSEVPVCSPRRTRRIGFASVFALAVLVGCEGGTAIDAPSPPSPPGAGPRVIWDLGAHPFPEVPLPNDIATYPDPSSPTGLRINASLIAPTGFERTLRADFNEMDGWGTFMPITVSFQDDLDLADLRRRHADDFDFRDDAVYLIDLETGQPVPLDVGNGNFPLTLRDPRGWFPNDPRAGGSNLLLSTVDEDTNRDGVLQPSEDTNFDGVMQRAAIFPAGTRAEDGLTTYWEPESRTLILRPLVPLRERARYAVVLTDRLRGASGPVRSPFPTIAHPAQVEPLAPLATHLQNRDLSSRFYGGLSWQGSAGSTGGRVAFAWSFTTQTTVSDLFAVYEGLHGRGPFARLAETAPNFRVARAIGGANCGPALPQNVYTVSAQQLQDMLRDLVVQVGYGGPMADALIESFRWLDYAAIARFDTPYLLGDPRSNDPDAHWHINTRTGEMGSIGRDTVQVWIFVPRARPGASAPFPVAFNAHGYSSGALQTLAFAGYFARFGIATVGINAPGHGFMLGSGIASALRTLLAGRCLGPFGTAAIEGRAQDLNGDGDADSGANFLTARVFHTRDMVRQTALDYMQLVRALQDPSFSAPGAVDYNGDGRADAPGDLNGDGTVDFGGFRDGRPVPIYMWGESLGGITSMVLGALDPAFTAVAPVSGGAGLTDVSLRSTVEGVGGAVLAPTMGPMIVAVPASERGPSNNRTRTACAPGQMSLRWIVPDAARIGELEFACAALGESGRIAPGDDVVVSNFGKGQERCARVQRDGTLFVPLPADVGDRVVVTVYRGAVVTDYGRCTRAGNAPVRAQIDTFEVGEGDCDDTCGHVPPNARIGSSVVRRARGTELVAPASGLGLRRQSAELRRFIQLAQAAIDPGDPINYAPLFFLRPRTDRAHPILTMTTVGDTDVPVATGNAFARAAGLLPFIAHPTGSALDEFATPEALYSRYDRTPNALLVDNFVIEGLSRLERTPPMMGDPRYLFDADDLDEGRQGFGERALTPPLRLVRAARPVVREPLAFVDPARAAMDLAATWSPRAGEPLASSLNAYVAPTGTHTFLPSDPTQPWDSGAYLTNLIARFFQSNGTDVVFYTDPAGHQCLASSNCAFMPQE